jgi:hypothetical protein
MVKAGIIKGMKAICEHVGYSEPTLLKHKREYPGMPMNKLAGEWVANQAQLEKFYQDLAAGKTEGWLNLPETGKPKSKWAGMGDDKTGSEGGGGEGDDGEKADPEA